MTSSGHGEMACVLTSSSLGKTSAEVCVSVSAYTMIPRAPFRGERHPSTSGRFINASSIESSDFKYPSLFLCVDVLFGFDGKNLLFSCGGSELEASSHKRAFLGGRLEAASPWLLVEFAGAPTLGPAVRLLDEDRE